MISQCSAILAHLEAGNSLTPLEAFERFGTLALHSRAAELRSQGYPVECELVKVGDKTVGRYSLLRVAYG